MKNVLVGSLAGCVATVPMTWVMEQLHEELPASERYPLPPRQVAMAVAEKAGVKDRMDESEKVGFTLASHFGFGTAMGAIYGPLSRSIPLPAPAAGVAFGLAVWAGNYLGLLPALDLLSPATKHPPRRTGLMIAAHVVWGLTTGIITELLLPDEKESVQRRSLQ